MKIQKWNEEFIAKNWISIPWPNPTWAEKITRSIIKSFRWANKFVYRWSFIFIAGYITMRGMIRAEKAVGFETMLLFLLAAPMVMQKIFENADKHDQKVDNLPMPEALTNRASEVDASRRPALRLLH